MFAASSSNTSVNPSLSTTIRMVSTLILVGRMALMTKRRHCRSSFHFSRTFLSTPLGCCASPSRTASGYCPSRRRRPREPGPVLRGFRRWRSPRCDLPSGDKKTSSMEGRLIYFSVVFVVEKTPPLASKSFFNLLPKMHNITSLYESLHLALTWHVVLGPPRQTRRHLDLLPIAVQRNVSPSQILRQLAQRPLRLGIAIQMVRQDVLDHGLRCSSLVKRNCRSR